MLVKHVYTSKEKSIYSCDMCGKECTLKDIHKINNIVGRKNKKIFDLCNRCFLIVCRSIKKYRKNHNKEE